jgi:hypothetical protein
MLETMRRVPVLLAVIVAVALLTPGRAAVAADEKQRCLAASDQGQQLRDDGKYERAREAFTSCARDACPTLVRRDCMKWLADLEQSSPSIVVGAKDEKGADLVNVTVLVDGAPLVTKLDGKPTVVDPGAHVFRFQTAGYPAVEQHVMVRAGEKSRVILVQFGPPPAPTPTPSAPAAAPATTAAAGTADHGDTPQGTRTSAWVFGGLAVAAFGAEAYFGISGLSDRSSLKSQPCAQTASCSESSVDSIRTKFTVADIALGVGIASAAISAYLFLAPPAETAPSHPSTTSSVDVVPVPGGAAMSVAGRF